MLNSLQLTNSNSFAVFTNCNSLCNLEITNFFNFQIANPYGNIQIQTPLQFTNSNPFERGTSEFKENLTSGNPLLTTIHLVAALSDDVTDKCDMAVFHT